MSNSSERRYAGELTLLLQNHAISCFSRGVESGLWSLVVLQLKFFSLVLSTVCEMSTSSGSLDKRTVTATSNLVAPRVSLGFLHIGTYPRQSQNLVRCSMVLALTCPVVSKRSSTGWALS
jgi:hypothetical protein